VLKNVKCRTGKNNLSENNYHKKLRKKWILSYQRLKTQQNVF
jgi:hypothetical protein